jgi:hypothetical protein
MVAAVTSTPAAWKESKQGWTKTERSKDTKQVKINQLLDPWMQQHIDQQRQSHCYSPFGLRPSTIVACVSQYSTALKPGKDSLQDSQSGALLQSTGVAFMDFDSFCDHSFAELQWPGVRCFQALEYAYVALCFCLWAIAHGSSFCEMSTLLTHRLFRPHTFHMKALPFLS